LTELKYNTLDAFENQDYPFENLVEKIVLKRDFSRNPIFDVVVELRNMEMATLEIPHLKLEIYPYHKKIARYDLLLNVLETPEGLTCTLEYSIRLWKASTIENYIEYFRRIISAVLANPGIALSDIFITEKKKKQERQNQFSDDLEME
jgi:non-ribosomal peptide synthetase component F